MIEIRPARDTHIRAVARRLRDADRREVQCLGLDPLRIAMDCQRLALFSSVAILDGKPVAIWGCGGSFLSVTGRPWLLTTPECEAEPVAFGLIYRREVRRMLGIFPRLENMVDASYDRAVRLLRIVGFTVDAPEPIGPDRVPFRRFWMVR